MTKKGQYRCKLAGKESWKYHSPWLGIDLCSFNPAGSYRFRDVDPAGVRGLAKPGCPVDQYRFKRPGEKWLGEEWIALERCLFDEGCVYQFRAKPTPPSFEVLMCAAEGADVLLRIKTEAERDALLAKGWVIER